MKMSEKLTKLLNMGNQAADEVENMGTNPAKVSNLQKTSAASPLVDGACRAYKIPAESASKPNIFVLIRLALAVVILAVGHFLKEPAAILVVVIQLIAAAVAGYDLVIKAIADIRNEIYIRESIPVLLAAILSFAIGRGFEGAIAIIIIQLALLLRDYAYCIVRTSIYNEAASPIALKNLHNGGEAVTEFETKMSKFSSIFAPAMLIVGIALIIALPIFKLAPFLEAVRRAVAIIVIASPCGVLCSIPINLLTSMALSERLGCRFKSSKVLDDCANIGAVAFEKSGTITSLDFKVTSINTDKMDPLTFLKVAAHSASVGNGPVYSAIIAAYDQPLSPNLVEKFFETTGEGVSVLVDNIEILLGTAKFLSDNSIAIDNSSRDLAVHMTVNGMYAGSISFGDSINPEARKTLSALGEYKIDHIAMLSSNRREKDRTVAAELHIAEYVAECSAGDREKHLLQMKTRVDAKRCVAYVASGLGYDKALDTAHVGIVLGSDNYCDAADVLVSANNISGIITVLSLSKHARHIVTISMLVGLASKVLFTVLAAFGIAPIWFTLLMDSCVSLGLIITCLNKSRLTLPSKLQAAEK